MLVGNSLSYSAAYEAYCLLTAYIREDKVGANYNKVNLTEFSKFLAEIIKHPENFTELDAGIVEELENDYPGHA